MARLRGQWSGGDRSATMRDNHLPTAPLSPYSDTRRPTGARAGLWRKRDTMSAELSLTNSRTTRRAWLVVQTKRGAEISDALDRSMQAVEAELAASIGAVRYQLFKDVLRELGEKQI